LIRDSASYHGELLAIIKKKGLKKSETHAPCMAELASLSLLAERRRD
jgi:hypothetical protein